MKYEYLAPAPTVGLRYGLINTEFIGDPARDNAWHFLQILQKEEGRGETVAEFEGVDFNGKKRFLVVLALRGEGRVYRYVNEKGESVPLGAKGAKKELLIGMPELFVTLRGKEVESNWIKRYLVYDGEVWLSPRYFAVQSSGEEIVELTEGCFCFSRVENTRVKEAFSMIRSDRRSRLNGISDYSIDAEHFDKVEMLADYAKREEFI